MRYVLAIVAVGALLAGCGKNNPGNPEAYQSGSSNCSKKFVEDYNALGNQVHSLATVADLTKLRESVVNFKATYAGVKCDAAQGGEKKMIDASKEADDLLNLIDHH